MFENGTICHLLLYFKKSIFNYVVLMIQIPLVNKIFFECMYGGEKHWLRSCLSEI